MGLKKYLASSYSQAHYCSAKSVFYILYYFLLNLSVIKYREATTAMKKLISYRLELTQNFCLTLQTYSFVPLDEQILTQFLTLTFPFQPRKSIFSETVNTEGSTCLLAISQSHLVHRKKRNSSVFRFKNPSHNSNFQIHSITRIHCEQ